MPDKSLPLLLALLWTVTITVLSLITLGDVGGEVPLPYKDKMVHFVFYFVFVWLWFVHQKSGVNDAKRSHVIFVAAVLYGLLMEACQSFFTTNRTADWFDVMANISGALTALLLIKYRLKRV